jgi:hypothetical protein
MNQPANFKIIVTDALQFFINHLLQIAALCLPWLLTVALVEYGIMLMGKNAEWATILVPVAFTFDLLIYPVYMGALIRLMARRAQREHPTNKELTAAAIKGWQPLFLVRIIVSGVKAISLVFFIAPSIFTLAFFAIPGLYIWVRLAFAEFHLVLEELKPIEAIQKSFHATRPYFGQILLLLAIFVIPIAVLAISLIILVETHKLDLIFNVLLGVLISFLALVVDVAIFRVYMSARQGNPDAA